MIKNLWILAVAALVFAGCYEDKGNYDYHDVNVMETINFNPAPDSWDWDGVLHYSYPMSVEDTTYITYSPVLEQSQIADESQLEFQWISLNDDDVPVDTAFTRDFTVGLPYQELVNYTVLFRLIDHSTGLEFYRELNITTREAFQNCWYVLHGNEGDRMLGTAEVLDGGTTETTADVYEMVHGVRRFQNATGLIYSSFDRMNSFYGYTDNEKLYVYEPDSCTQLRPFTFETRKTLAQIVQNAPRTAIVTGVDDEVGDCAAASTMAFACADGQAYWSRSTQGYFFTMKAQAGVTYHADRLFIPRGVEGASPDILIWDDTRKSFFYYPTIYPPYYMEQLNAHPGDGAYDQYDVTYRVQPAPAEAFEEGELTNMEVLGMVLSSTDGKTGVILHSTAADDSYWYYEMGRVGENGPETFDVERTELIYLSMTETSVFATSADFPDFLFYTDGGGNLYSYNLITGVETLMYTVSGTITDIAFAISRTYESSVFPSGLNSRMGLGVTTADGQGEVHDLRLSLGGDVTESYVCTGFGPVVDMVFALRNIQNL